jgi:hypothetical protein
MFEVPEQQPASPSKPSVRGFPTGMGPDVGTALREAFKSGGNA